VFPRHPMTGLMLALFFTGTAAHAGTGYYLVTVYDNEGEQAIDYRFWSVKGRSGAAVWSPELGLSWNPTRNWYTNLRAISLRTEASGHVYLGTGWQNDLLLTRGQYPFDLAIHTDITHFRDRANGREVEFGPVLQTEAGRARFNANLFFSRIVGASRPEPSQLQYQWQARHHFTRASQLGLQGFGELGPWNDWLPREKQSHRAGPVFGGELDTSGGHTWKYEFAWLAGKVRAAPAKTFSMRIQLAF
jgi:hypothetical protein